MDRYESDDQCCSVLFHFKNSKKSLSDYISLYFSCMCHLFKCLVRDCCSCKNDFMPLILPVKK